MKTVRNNGTAVGVTDLAAPHRPERAATPRASVNARRSFWLKQLHQWHWISAAVSLIGMILFAVTGITLNLSLIHI